MILLTIDVFKKSRNGEVRRVQAETLEIFNEIENRMYLHY